MSRFDGVVLAAFLGLVLGTVLLVLAGNRVGVRVLGIIPANGATGVSANTGLQITFDQPVYFSAGEALFTVTPSVSGTLRSHGSTLIFSPSQPLLPDTRYTVKVANKIDGRQGQPFIDELKWHFQTRPPLLLFAAPDRADIEQLFVINPNSGEQTQLANEKFGVFDYQLSPDAATIAFAALREDGGSDLWAVSPDGGDPYLLLACPGAGCNGAGWAANGQRLVFEKREMSLSGDTSGPARLWWLNIATGESMPLFEDNHILGYGATWSPDGTWLSFVSPEGVQLYNQTDGRSLLVPGRMGGAAVWHPRSDAFLVTDIENSEAGFLVHLLKAAPDGSELVDISGVDEPVEDSSPAWSPDGEWVAFVRKVAGASMGKQVWLMRADGSEARYLTNKTDIHHSLPRWSPDGSTLAYQRFPLKAPNATPSIWLLNVESGKSRELVSPGNRPVWLP